MLQRPVPRLILASASASRRMLLAASGVRFDVLAADIDEAAVKRKARAEAASAEDAALRLADRKAAAISQREPTAVVIGADQILVCARVWYDKPTDMATARDQLRELRGREHALATAVVCHQNGIPLWKHITTPRLRMRAFSDGFLEDYLTAEAATVFSTVGAYRVEGVGVQLFDAIDGDHSAILGLPLLPLLAFLRQRRILVV
jgi:septum formation protein